MSNIQLSCLRSSWAHTVLIEVLLLLMCVCCSMANIILTLFLYYSIFFYSSADRSESLDCGKKCMRWEFVLPRGKNLLRHTKKTEKKKEKPLPVSSWSRACLFKGGKDVKEHWAKEKVLNSSLFVNFSPPLLVHILPHRHGFSKMLLWRSIFCIL